MSQFDCDVLIVGAGYGGSVCALRAAEAGLHVVVLERGRRMDDAAYDALTVGQTPLMHSSQRVGLGEVPRIEGLVSLVGCAVGGGSHINTAVAVPANDEIFASGWPAGITAEGMRPYFDRVLNMVNPRPMPCALPRTGELERIGEVLGRKVTRLPLSIEDVNEASLESRGSGDDLSTRLRIVSWLRGGAIVRKRTIDQTYLAAAERAGAMIRPLHEVKTLQPFEGGFRVDYEHASNDGAVPGTFSSRRVILAAGTLGTLRLLLRCRDEFKTLPALSPMLGRRFFTNGDLGAVLVGPCEGGQHDGGPPVTAWMDLWPEDRLYLMEIGRLPLPPIIDRAFGILRPFNGARKKGHWLIGVMGYDESTLTILRRDNGRFLCRRDTPRQSNFDERVLRRLRELADAAGASLLLPPRWFLDRWAVTVHPLGGAAMADSRESGVTNANGEVFGYRGFLIADGSLLPTPIGRPPSMTIAALAERVAEHLVSR